MGGTLEGSEACARQVCEVRGCPSLEGRPIKVQAGLLALSEAS